MTRTEIKLRLALIELLYRSYGDERGCTCDGPVFCEECEAMQALGLGRFTGESSTWKSLREAHLKLERAQNLRSVP